MPPAFLWIQEALVKPRPVIILSKNSNSDKQANIMYNTIISRHFGIFEDATNHCSCGQKYPTDKYPKRIQLKNDSRSCLGTSVTTRPMHSRTGFFLEIRSKTQDEKTKTQPQKTQESFAYNSKMPAMFSKTFRRFLTKCNNFCLKLGKDC